MFNKQYLRGGSRLLVALSGLGGIIAATSAIPVTHASGGIPASCSGFVQTYFSGSYVNGSTAPFTLVTEGTNLVAGYAEGSLTLTNGGWTGYSFAGPSLSGTGTEYFSDRRYYQNGSLSAYPFNPAATDQLGVSIWESSFVYNQELGTTLTLKSWGNAQVAVTVQGCMSNNQLYGTMNSGGANTGAIIISVGSLQAPPR